MANNSDMPREFEIFREVWIFFKEFYFPSNEESYWDAVVSAGGEIMERFPDSPLCRDLVMAIIGELERKGVKDNENIVTRP